MFNNFTDFNLQHRQWILLPVSSAAMEQLNNMITDNLFDCLACTKNCILLPSLEVQRLFTHLDILTLCISHVYFLYFVSVFNVIFYIYFHCFVIFVLRKDNVCLAYCIGNTKKIYKMYKNLYIKKLYAKLYHFFCTYYCEYNKFYVCKILFLINLYIGDAFMSHILRICRFLHAY